MMSKPHLDELEDIDLSLDRLENPAKRWSLDDLEKELDLDHSIDEQAKWMCSYVRCHIASKN